MNEPTPDPPPLAETHIILGEWMAANNSMLSSMQYDSLKIIIDGLIADRAAGRALEAVPDGVAFRNALADYIADNASMRRYELSDLVELIRSVDVTQIMGAPATSPAASQVPAEMVRVMRALERVVDCDWAYMGKDADTGNPDSLYSRVREGRAILKELQCR